MVGMAEIIRIKSRTNKGLVQVIRGPERRIRPARPGIAREHAGGAGERSAVKRLFASLLVACTRGVDASSLPLYHAGLLGRISLKEAPRRADMRALLDQLGGRRRRPTYINPGEHREADRLYDQRRDGRGHARVVRDPAGQSTRV
jgi:hypothetical protein